MSMADFFTLLIDNQLVTFEKKRVITIEPTFNGTRIILEASHEDEEPFIYLVKEPYEAVIKAYLG